MSEKMKNIPKMRFPEFANSGEWEETTLNNIILIMTDFVANGSFQSLRENVNVVNFKNFAIYVRLMDLRLGLGHSEQKYIDKSSYEFLKKSALNGQELLIANIGANVGEVWQMPKINFPATLAPNMIMMKFKSHIYNSFPYYFLSSEKGQKHISKAISGSGHPKINKTDLKQVNIFIPKLHEQQKIADCLSSLDSLISAQSKKVELLKKHKKGLLQNLFPREGESIPRLRFPEFVNDGEWEEKELGNLFNFLRGSVFSKADIIENGLNKCIHYGELFTIYKEKITEIKSYTNIENGQFSQKNDILMPSSDVTPEGLATASAIFEDGIIIGGDVNLLRPKKEVNSLFVSYFLNLSKKEIIKLVSGTTVKHIYNKDISKLSIKLPKPNEQQKNADCLSSLDEQITQQTKKLQALKEHKKGLMQQLFPTKEVSQ